MRSQIGWQVYSARVSYFGLACQHRSNVRSDDVMLPMQTFAYSVTYLMMLFLFLMVDHYFMALTAA